MYLAKRLPTTNRPIVRMQFRSFVIARSSQEDRGKARRIEIPLRSIVSQSCPFLSFHPRLEWSSLLEFTRTNETIAFPQSARLDDQPSENEPR
jgi:hypothetical protein